ncbi:IS110 family transposase [Mangrovicoccus ximenensis]|uniref:IS110 family transposase n=1 Tax=Mangrovicoccus ximenensis TaxID=1911570 RepID=UPI000D3CD5FA|nr:transposase [Mangrovicoccus ximenensis]
MMDKQSEGRTIFGGVDAHKDLHVAAVVDDKDRVIAGESFPTTRHGYRLMLEWMRSFGDLRRAGIEATGTHGAAGLRHFRKAGVQVLEVTGPDKHGRRARGKSGTFDAEAAAHAAFSGKRTVTPKSRDGMIGALRVLRAVRKTAVQARRIALQMMGNTIVAAPDAMRDSIRHMTRMPLIRTLAAWRPDMTACRISLKSLARRYLELHGEIADLDKMIQAIVDELAPGLVAQDAIGYHSAAQLLIAAGANPDRLKSEASFAALCGVSPIPASSGKINRHRLNRGGDRAANSALHIIADGRSKREALRCVKRCIAREVYRLIRARYDQINQTQIVA